MGILESVFIEVNLIKRLNLEGFDFNPVYTDFYQKLYKGGPCWGRGREDFFRL